MTQQHAVDGVVRNHQQRIVVAKAFGCARERRPRAIEHHLQRFAAGAGHQHRVGRVAPRLQAFAVAVADFAGKQAFPTAVGNFHQSGISDELRCARIAQCEFSGGFRAHQRRCDSAIDADIRKARPQRARLRFAHRRQRDVFLTLIAAFGVPRRFAVTCE